MAESLRSCSSFGSVYNGSKAIIDAAALMSPSVYREPSSRDPLTVMILNLGTALRNLLRKLWRAASSLSVAPTGLREISRKLIFVVSPSDYFTKISQLQLSAAGWGLQQRYFPVPTKLIQSVFVPAGEALRDWQAYFMGSEPARAVRSNTPTEYHFLEMSGCISPNCMVTANRSIPRPYPFG